MTPKQLYAGWGVMLVVLWGCQAVLAPGGKDNQANAYIEQAQAFETQGNLVEALEQYRLAQTVAPDDPDIANGVKRLEDQLDRLAASHYQNGLRFRDKGQWELAKKEFLKALRCRPGHAEAAAMLQQRQPRKDRQYVTHTIAPGESVSRLALKYYGDYRLFTILADYNGISDPTSVKVGQKVKVPLLNGAYAGPATKDETKRAAAGTPPAAAKPSAAPAEKAPAPLGDRNPEQAEAVDQVAEYRYMGIATLQRAAASNPDDDTAADLLFQTHCQKGLILYDKADYLGAGSSFENAAAIKPECSDCKPYVDRSLSEYKELQYNQGIIHFGQQELTAAIAAWQKVIAVDPGYKDVQQNLKKATLLNERLEKIRQSSTE